MKNIFQSKKLKITLIILAECIFAFAFFAGGVAVGAHKAQFTSQWYQGYNRNFIGSGSKRDLVSGHGVTGVVFSVDGVDIKVKSIDGVEKIIHVTEKTSIRKYHDDILIADIKSGDKIIVVGEPNDQGIIIAKFVRVMNSN